MLVGDQEKRKEQRENLLLFGLASRHKNGFGYLDGTGELIPQKPVELYITCRMTYVYALALRWGEEYLAADLGPERLRDMAAHGIEALSAGALRDQKNGGWFDCLGENRCKAAYAHAFVLLAAATAKQAGIEGAAALLAEAITVVEKYFWDDSAQMMVEQWDCDWKYCDPYRGANSNMHSVEAFLAVGYATGEEKWYRRASAICRRILGYARENNWRIPEHFRENWEVELEYNRDCPTDPFRPYGATIGHGLEWSRLWVCLNEVYPHKDIDFVGAARKLAGQSIADGWHVDGRPGFVYTIDWAGQPVCHARMHWVLAEAIGATTVLGQKTGDPAYLEKTACWWNYAATYLIDRKLGSWRHELDENNCLASGTWLGKPDIYHAFQAALLADLPLAGSFIEAVEKTRL